MLEHAPTRAIRQLRSPEPIQKSSYQERLVLDLGDVADELDKRWAVILANLMVAQALRTRRRKPARRRTKAEIACRRMRRDHRRGIGWLWLYRAGEHYRNTREPS